jgi:hypothetical protein
MEKRLEIVVRNPGFEGTESALGAYVLDFKDRKVFERARGTLHSALAPNAALGRSVILVNEDEDEVGFDPGLYVSHRIGDAKDWIAPKWELPQGGAEAPPREAE